MQTHRHFAVAACCGALLVTAGCERQPAHYATQLANICPTGWHVSAATNVIVLRRDAPVWIMGKVSNPPRHPDQSVEQYFKSVGQEIHYQVRLRFVAQLPQREYENLKAARDQAATRLNQGASGKSEYSRLQMDYAQCQVPRFFTDNYSIFADHWADGGTNFGYRMEPRFVDVYPPEAAAEIEGVIGSLKRVFKEYENPGT